MSVRQPSSTRLSAPQDPVEPLSTDPEDSVASSAPDDTAGTGTAIALGCIAATLFLIVIGLIVIGATQLFG